MHAAEVLGPLQRFCEACDGDGRGVGGEDGVLTDLLFGFRQHCVLDLGVFDHRFHHDIHRIETGVGQRRVDAVEHVAHLRGGHLTPVHTLGQQLVGLRQAQVQPVLVDVLHQDGDAAVGRLVGDTAAHDAGAQHSCTANLAISLLFPVTCFLAQQLVGEENPHQRGSDRRDRQFRKAFRLDLEGIYQAHAAGFFDDIDSFHRRRVVLAGLLPHH